MAGYLNVARDFESRATMEPFTEDDAPSAFSDTLAAAFALTRREELSDSAGRAFRAKNDERAKVIAKLGGDEQTARAYSTIPEGIIPQWRDAEREGRLESDPNWIGMGGRDGFMPKAYLHVRDFERRFPDEVKDDTALLEEFKAEAAKLRAAEQHTLERGGGFAAFLGSAGAALTDPLVLATLPLGAPEAGAGRTLLQVFARTAAIEGSIAAATEIPIQAQVFAFKRELEAPWTWKDSAMNVIAAGVGGAAIGGVIGTGLEGAARALGHYRKVKEAGKATPEMDDAAQALEDTVALDRENPLDREFLGPRADDVHERAFEVARSQEARGEPVAVADQTAPFEPQGELTDVLRRAKSDSELVDIDPRAVQVDAKTFQFKAGADAAGVTETLKDVVNFDRRLAGVALIWERSDGAQFIADGHQRLALARRALEAGQDPTEVRLNGFVLREADGVTAADARRVAAIKNMAEGTGSALDAAKILREVGALGDAVLPPLPPRSALVRQARGLAQLSDENFLRVVNGVVDERFGALVGGATDNPELQGAMLEVLRRAQPANEVQARSIVEQVKTAGLETRTTSDLFGEQTFAESLYLERAQVLDAALKEARKDRTVFGRLVSEADRIQETGSNRLDQAANLQRIQEAADATTQVTALANAKGPLSEALSDAARRVRAGEPAGRAATDFLAAARREILTGDQRGARARGTRPAGEAPRGAAQLTPKKGAPVRVAELAPADRPEALRAFKAKQAGQTVETFYADAPKRQAALKLAGDEIAEELGLDTVQVVDPGVKARKGSEDKIARKGYADASELTDVNRIGFLVDSPDTAAKVVDRLGQRFELLDEGVNATGLGYIDHKALVRFPDGRVAEVQLWDPAMARAKFGEGHALYEQGRVISADDAARDPALAARIEQIEEASKDLYAQAIAEASPEWRRVAMMAAPEDVRARVQELVRSGSLGSGSGGDVGNVSRKALRESSRPDSSTSTGATRAQESEPGGTNKPSTPPPGTERTTAGRPSQLKNRSAIDAPPRSIVRQVVDERTGTPAATRTGTVTDEDYAAVMTQAADMIEQHGERLRVGNEVNGELVERSAAAAIEDLDRLEDTLERVRLCSAPERAIS